jgi:hypothetical protein
VEYETGSAEIESDDEVANEMDLKVGQVVTIKGRKNKDGVTGTADSIAYNDRVEGPISSITGNTLVVLGQTIIVDEGTEFDDSVNTQSLAGLSIGDAIEVSGFLNSSGEVIATYIESNAPGGVFELVGIVTNLDSDASTFDIGSQAIDFSGAALEDFGAALLADGDQVEVKGRVLGAEGELIASKVEFEGDELSENDEVEVEGIISSIDAAGDFEILGVIVSTTSATQFFGGTADDLALNVKVEVEGTIDAQDILVAGKVKFKHQEDTRFEAVVDAVDVDASQVTVLGITIVLNNSTRRKDHSEMDVKFFGVDDISAGDFLEIRGKLEVDGIVTATRLRRDDLDDRSSVRGLVQSNDAAATLVIAGVTIRTNEETDYRDALEMSMTQADFFAAALEGVEVKVKGQETDISEITAAQLELEDDD